MDTPFHHQGRVKGVGVDCVGLLIGVARDLDIVPADYEVEMYGRVPDGSTLLQQASARMVRRPSGAALEPGCVVLVAVAVDPQHMGILGDYWHGGLSLIHALSTARPSRVVEARYMPSRALRFIAAFDFPGVA